jgi:hypothetical protein
MGYVIQALPVTETAAEKMKPNQKMRVKRVINKQLYDMGRIFWPSLSEAADLIGEMLVSGGLDPEPLEGFWCGSSGRISGHVGNNLWIVVSWYKMDSGRYEVTSYLS